MTRCEYLRPGLMKAKLNAFLSVRCSTNPAVASSIARSGWRDCAWTVQGTDHPPKGPMTSPELPPSRPRKGRSAVLALKWLYKSGRAPNTCPTGTGIGAKVHVENARTGHGFGFSGYRRSPST